MLIDLLLASAMVTWTVIVHFTGLLLLIRFLNAGGHRFRPYHSLFGQGVLVVTVVLGLFAIHTVEIWSYALCYWWLGALTSFEEALYFSTVTFTTIGYGDIVMGEQWRLFASIEGANGLILFGWSTAFLISLMRQLRSLEHDWLERPPATPPNL